VTMILTRPAMTVKQAGRRAPENLELHSNEVAFLAAVLHSSPSSYDRRGAVLLSPGRDLGPASACFDHVQKDPALSLGGHEVQCQKALHGDDVDLNLRDVVRACVISRETSATIPTRIDFH
jgi:hypothetical protein